MAIFLFDSKFPNEIAASYLFRKTLSDSYETIVSLNLLMTPFPFTNSKFVILSLSKDKYFVPP